MGEGRCQRFGIGVVVDGNSELVEDQPVEGVVEEHDVSRLARQAHLRVEFDVGAQPVAPPGGEGVGDGWASGGFQSQFEERDRSISVGGQPVHDVAQICRE